MVSGQSAAQGWLDPCQRCSSSASRRSSSEWGNTQPLSPPHPFFEAAYLPLLRRMGANVTSELVRAGFYPAGVRVASHGSDVTHNQRRRCIFHARSTQPTAAAARMTRHANLELWPGSGTFIP